MREHHVREGAAFEERKHELLAEGSNKSKIDVYFREDSSAGSEHLPYKQRVGGSNPSAPTLTTLSYLARSFFYIHPSEKPLKKSIKQIC